jgi:two-component system NtrC family response regulator
MRRIDEAGPSDANVLITGESGTGKELVAKAIHQCSPRAAAPFVIVNCAAIPESLMESELFGHIKGAFTGAVLSRCGRLAQADSGTVFLDEIGDMPLSLQVKILRYIQEKTVEPLGGSAPLRVNTRIIAATNQNLEQAVIQGRFRQDLYYRLNVYPISAPPLRERKGDIPMLLGHFAERLAAKTGGSPLRFSHEALCMLSAYPWPGNIRELENCVERLSVAVDDVQVTPAKLKACSVALSTLKAGESDRALTDTLPALPVNLEQELDGLERALLLQALEQSGGVQVKAAELLRITERSMWHRIKKHGIHIVREAS